MEHSFNNRYIAYPKEMAFIIFLLWTWTAKSRVQVQLNYKKLSDLFLARQISAQLWLNH